MGLVQTVLSGSAGPLNWRAVMGVKDVEEPPTVKPEEPSAARPDASSSRGRGRGRRDRDRDRDRSARDEGSEPGDPGFLHHWNLLCV